MSNSLLKKIVAGVSATAITLSIVAPVSSVSAAASAEIEAANKLASQGIIKDNSANVAEYKLTDNITRREMAKVMINLAGIEVTDTCEGKFADLQAGDWGCKYAEAALAKGFVKGNPTFGADRNISKWESLKFIQKARGINVETGDNYQKDYVESAVANKIIAESFTDYNTSAKRGWIFTAGANALEVKPTDSEGGEVKLCEIFGTCGEETPTEPTDPVKPTEPTEPTEPTTPTEPTEPTTPTTPSDVEGKVLEVSLSPDSPRKGERIPEQTPRITMLKLDFAAGDEDVELKTIKMDSIGFGDAGKIDDVVLYNAEGEKVTRQRSVSSSDLNVELDFLDNFTVKAGTTQTLTVSAQIADTNNGDVFGLKVTEVKASTSVEGTPVAGAELESVEISNQGILVLGADKASQKITIGEDAKLAGWKIKNDNDKEDISIKTIRLKQTGSVNESNIEGMYVEADGKKVAENLTFAKDYVTINFGEGYVLPKEKSAYVYFALKGVVTGEPADTLQFQIEKSDDVYAIGDKNGFNAPVRNTSNTTFTGNLDVSEELTIEGSEITASFTRADKDASNVDVDDFDFGTLSLKANSGNYNLESFKILLTVDGKNATDVGTKDLIQDELLTDIRLGGISSEDEVKLADAVTKFGGVDPLAPAADADLKYFAVEFKDITLRKGETKEMKLTADIPKEARKGTKYKFVVDFQNGEFKLEDEDSDKTYTNVTGAGSLLAKDVLSSYSGFDTRNVEIKAASLEVTNNKIDSEDVVLGNVITQAYKGTIEAGSSADVRIRNLTFTNTGDNKVNLDLVVAKAFLKIGTKTIETTEIDGTTVKFTSMDEIIKAGSSNKQNMEVSLQFKSADDDAIDGADDDITTANDNTDKIRLAINAATDIDAEDKEVGTNLAAADISGDLTDKFSNVISLTNKGALTIDVDIVKNDSSEEADLNYFDRFLLGGTDNVMLAKLEMDAKKEKVKVKDLNFETASFASADLATEFRDSIENVRMVKENKSTVVGNGTVTISSDKVAVKFEDMENLVVDTENKEVYYLIADVKKVDLDPDAASAVSGLNTTFTLKGTVAGDIEGDASNKDISANLSNATSKKVTLIASDIAGIDLKKLDNTPAVTSFIDVAEIVITPTSTVNVDASDDPIKALLKKVVFRTSDIAVSGITKPNAQADGKFSLKLREKDSGASTASVELNAGNYTFDNLNTGLAGDAAKIDGTTTFVLSLEVNENATNDASVDADAKVTVKLNRDTVEFRDGTADYATGTLTFSGVVADGETVVIDGRTFEFDTNSAIGGDVAVDVSGGVTADDAVAALAAAINGDTTTAAKVNAKASTADDTVVITADASGTAGNAITTTETCGNGAFGGGTLTGGLAAGTSGTIFTKVYATGAEVTAK
ncbi:MAG: S-layer homology domain-containing protein [Candidatus Gracilibacteria bacterium]|jgi:hypothetical protein|nr:S-layer homology domain-containing protein [Candidatus Gracilibacteria bacterium]